LNLEFQGSIINAPRFFNFKTQLNGFQGNQSMHRDQESFGLEIPGNYEAKQALT
jgi:hypothetical protein